MTVHGINQPLLRTIFRFLSESDIPAACGISKVCRQAMDNLKSNYYGRQLSLSEDARLAAFNTDFGLGQRPLDEIVSDGRDWSSAVLFANAVFVPPAIFEGSADAYARLTRYWENLSLHLLNADEPAKKRFALFCKDFKRYLQDCLLQRDGSWIPGNNWAVLRENEGAQRVSALAVLGRQRISINEAAEYLKTFLVKERVASRFQRTFQDLQLADTQKWNRFSLDQLALAKQTGNGAMDVTNYRVRNPIRTPVQRLIRTEEIILDHEPELEADFTRLCAAITAVGIQIPPGTNAQRRRWMNDDANLPHLAQRESLTLRDCRSVPPEIGRLRGLRSLTINAEITSLPPELANLPHLSSLEIRGSGFPAIPPILEQLPALSHLAIRGNTPPIRAISDALAKKTQMNSFSAHLWGALGEFLTERLDSYEHGGSDSWYLTSHYLGIDPEHLTDVPFSTWFRGAFSIPYIPHVVFALPIVIPLIQLNIADCLLSLSLSRLLEGLGWLEYVGLTIDIIFAGIATALYIAISVLPALVINLAILPLNLLINYGIEPLVQLCAPRMKHIQDAPAAAG